MRSALEFCRAFLPRSPARQLRLEEDILEELQFHLERRTEANRQCGMSEEEARNAALKQFGDTESILDACLAARDGHPGRRVARFATRVVPLGLASGSAAAVLLVLYSLVVRLPATYPPDEDWIVVWWENEPAGMLVAESSIDDYMAWKTRAHTVKSVALATYRSAVSRFGKESERLMGKYVADDYLRQHGIRPAIGRIFGRDSLISIARPAVISYDLWQRRYHRDRAVLGTPLDVDGRYYTIIGVAPKGYQTYYSFDFFAPLDLESVGDRTARRFLVSARLNETASADEAQKEFAAIALDRNPGDSWLPRVRRPQDVYSGRYPRQLVPFAILALMLLVVAVARSRFKSISTISTGLGPPLIGVTVVGLMACAGTIGLLRNTILSGVDQRFNFGLDPSVVVGYMSLVTFAVFASARRPKRVVARSSMDTDSSRPQRLSPALVLTSTCTFLMLVSAFVLTNDWWSRRSPDVGFDTEHVFTLPLLLPGSHFSNRDDRRIFFRHVIDRIDKIESIDQYSFTKGFPTLTEVRNVGVNLHDSDLPGVDTWVKVGVQPVGPDYFETIGIKVLEGTAFKHDRTDERLGLAVVNASFAKRYWPRGSAVGRQFSLFRIDFPFEVTAVVDDAVSSSPGDEHNPMLYPLIWHWTVPQYIVVKTHDEFSSVAQEIRSAVADVNPSAHVGEITPAGAALSASSQTRAMTAAFLWVSALLSLLLSSSFTLRSMRRFAEKGVRMLTMNRRGTVFRRASFSPLFLGVSASLLIGVILSTPLSHLLIREMQLDPQVGFLCIVVPTLLLVGTHVAAAYIPYRQIHRLTKAVSSA